MSYMSSLAIVLDFDKPKEKKRLQGFLDTPRVAFAVVE
jgi:hypothetical protein